MASNPPSRSPASYEPMLFPQGDYAGKPALRIQKSVVVVGADEHCHLHLISASVSRHHALIIHDQDGVYIRDLGSRTKVVVNGQPHRETLLVHEDEIHIGKFSFRYAFTPPGIEPAAPVPAIRIMVNGRPAPIPAMGRTLLIGKGDGCDISLPNDSVSSRHAVIFTARGKRYLRDLDSRTGTLLDGLKIHQQEIHPGAEIRVGDSVITLAEIVQPAEVIEAPHFEEPPAIALETNPGPAAEAPVHSEDTLPIPLDAAPELEQTPPASPEPVAQTPGTPEPLKTDLGPDSKTAAAESAVADTSIDLNVDAIPVDPEPARTLPASQAPTAQSSDVSASLKLEIESDPEAAAVESAFADAEIELSKDKEPIPLEPEPQAHDEEAATPELAGETATGIETLAPAGESADREFDLSDTALDMNPEPAEEPKEGAVEEPAQPATETAGLSAATPMPPTIAPQKDHPTTPTAADDEPIAKPAVEGTERRPATRSAVIELSSLSESPIDFGFDLDLHLDYVTTIVAVEPPPIGQSVPIQPKIELTPMESAPDEPLNAPPQDAPGEAPIQESGTNDPPRSTSEEPPEKPRKRPARGRKTATKTETKPPKATRSGTKRQPPQSVWPAAPPEPNVESAADASENWERDADLAPSPADEIPQAFVPDGPVEIAPAISVQPQVPGTSPPSDELSTDVWGMPSETTDEDSAPAITNEQVSEAPALPAARDIAEAPLDRNDQSTGDLKMPASATDEVPVPLISDDQTAQRPALAAEPGIPEAPVVGDELATGEWALPPSPSEEISAPVISDPLVAVAEPPSIEPSLPPDAARPPAAAVVESPMSSFVGYGFVGGGAVNLDHFVGGLPINLPELPPAPAGFGKIRIDVSGKPSDVGMTAPRTETPPIAAAAPQAPAPQVSAAQPPPAKPVIKPPPVSFSVQLPEELPFSEDVYHPLKDGSAERQTAAPSPKTSSPFDGLAMGVALETEIFSDMAASATPTNDAALSGAARLRPHDYLIPDGPERAKRSLMEPEPNTAEDRFFSNRAEEPDDAAPTVKPSAQRPETPLPSATREEMNGLQSELTGKTPGESQLDATIPPPRAPESSDPAKRRFRIPFLMPLILIGVGVALAAIWRFIPVQSMVNGTMTFLNLSFIPGTQESVDFEAAQRRLLDDQTREHAAEILARDDPGVDQGFLKTPQLFNQVAASVSLSSSTQAASPQTLLVMSSTGSDKEGDRLRMLALLQSLADRNAPHLDGNRRIREELHRAQQNVDDAQQKLDKIRDQLSALTPVINAAPSRDQLDSATQKRTTLEQARLNAESALSRDRADLARLATPPAAGTPPASVDPQLKQMRQELADLSAEMDSARSDQLAGAAIARQKLQAASRQFDEQIASANTLLGGGSQLRQFVDSAMDSQTKARDLINMLIVDGEDLELQLEDTRRDVEDLIQTQQADKWALDPQLQSLRENLESAQHRFNANAGQGITDPRILDPLQREIDNWTVQVRQRQAELGADPGEIRVQESLDSIIDALRKKLAKEKHQTDEVLDPLQKQLAQLDPVVAALPEAQQNLARQIHERLDALNDARQKFADSFGDEQIAPSAKVAELNNRIADLKADIAARQADLERSAVAARDEQHNGDLATVKARLLADQNDFDNASKNLEAGLSAYDDVHAKQVAAEAAQQKRANLLDDQRSASADLETAKRDRDETQAAADHAFDIKPVTAADVIAVSPPDPRMMYSLAVMGGGLIAFALAAVFSQAGPRRSRKTSAAPKVAADYDSLEIPMASDSDHAATA